MNYQTIILAAALVVSTSAARAQADSANLPPIVITATRVETRLAAGTSVVTVLDGRALEAQGIRDLAEALRMVPGMVIVRSGSQGALTSMFLRGGESDHVRVLVDGVAVNEPGGAIDLGAWSLDNVEKIEVVRGAASVLHGTDAVTGVVQIFTRRGRTDPGSAMRVRVEGGSYNTRSASAAGEIAGDRADLSVAAILRRSDGLLPRNNEARNATISGRAAWRGAGDGVLLALSARHHDDRYHYPTDGAGRVVDANAHRDDERTVVSLDASRDLGRKVRLELSAGSLAGNGGTTDLPDAPPPGDTAGLHTYLSSASTRRRVASARLRLTPQPAAVIALGIERMTESQDARDSSNYSVEPNHFTARRVTNAIYAQLLGEVKRVELMAGARFDDNSVHGGFMTARTGAAIRLGGGVRLRASTGTAFKAPAFHEQFNTAFTIGNGELGPELSRMWEVGVAARAGRVNVEATWFDQIFRDLIQYAWLAPGEVNYFNVARASARGLDVTGAVPIGRVLQADIGATFLRTRVVDAGHESGEGAVFVEGERLLRRPSRQASLGITAKPGARTSSSLRLVAVGERDDRNFSTFPALPVQLPAYLRIDVSASRILLERTGGGR
ncbi:MAG: TonB-dependent receptor plug domain-containing protein, partial [Gemmatimonadota bacterium]